MMFHFITNKLKVSRGRKHICVNRVSRKRKLNIKFETMAILLKNSSPDSKAVFGKSHNLMFGCSNWSDMI